MHIWICIVERKGKERKEGRLGGGWLLVSIASPGAQPLTLVLSAAAQSIDPSA